MSDFKDIAKELTLKALEKDFVSFGPPEDNTAESLNEEYAKEIGLLYNSIYRTITQMSSNAIKPYKL